MDSEDEFWQHMDLSSPAPDQDLFNPPPQAIPSSFSITANCRPRFPRPRPELIPTSPNPIKATNHPMTREDSWETIQYPVASSSRSAKTPSERSVDTPLRNAVKAISLVTPTKPKSQPRLVHLSSDDEDDPPELASSSKNASPSRLVFHSVCIPAPKKRKSKEPVSPPKRPKVEDSRSMSPISRPSTRSSRVTAHPPSVSLSSAESTSIRSGSDTTALPIGLLRDYNIPLSSVTGPKADTRRAERLFDTIHLDRWIVKGAHNGDLQKLLDDNRIEWGVQWMIYAGIQAKSWDATQVRSNLSQLKGTHAQVMPNVAVLLGDQRSTAASQIPTQFDLEQKAIMEGKGRGLGLMNDSAEWPAGWYGGRLQQKVTVVETAPKVYDLVLMDLEMTRSTRLGRNFGSRRVVQVKIPKAIRQNDRPGLLSFLSHKFVIAGRVFVPTPPKDDTIYLLEINEDFERRPIKSMGDYFRVSYGAFFEWHNPISLNSNQPLAKFNTRFVLVLSSSLPAVEFAEENIRYLDDIVTDDWLPKDGNDKPPAEKILTDGCGLINHYALLEIQKLINGTFPYAIQGRIAGAKGLWILHPDNNDQFPIIWIFKSQVKIQYDGLDRSHRILDFLNGSKINLRHNLSEQSILNLHHNGVPSENLAELLESGIEEEVGGLLRKCTNPTMEQAMKMNILDNIGHLTSTRQARIAQQNGVKARALGLTRDWRRGEDLAPNGGGRDPFSGAPRTVSESAFDQFQAGVSQWEDETLFKHCRRAAIFEMDSAIDEYHLPLPKGKAVEGLVVPDPLGVLGPGEVYFKSSVAMEDVETRLLFYNLTGPILIGRFPLRLVSDIQKVTAVDKPELARWLDVIIVSTQGFEWGPSGTGKRSLMSVLGGGDLDGDRCFLISEQRIVEPFQPKPAVIAPTNILGDNFERDVQSVTAFDKSLQSVPAKEGQLDYFQRAIAGLEDSYVGFYSAYHQASVWKYGYDHSHSTRLALMGNVLLDAGKTGYRLQHGISDLDKRRFGSKPKCMGGKGRQDPPRRSTDPFVLEILRSRGEEVKHRLLRQYDTLQPPLVPGSNGAVSGWRKDLQLLVPQQAARDRIKYYESSGPDPIRITLEQELRLLDREIEELRSRWRDNWSQDSSGSGLADGESYERHLKAQKTMQDGKAVILRRFAELALQGPHPMTHDIQSLKASIAYAKGPSFGWAVAFSELCMIKAKASSSGVAPTMRQIDDLKSFPSTSRRIIMQE